MGRSSNAGPRRVIISPTAQRELDELWHNLATAVSVEMAEGVIARIDHAFKKLAFMPGMGHERVEFKNSRVRVWSVYSYLIVYRFTATTLTISRVVNGRRDLRRIFRRHR